LGALKTKDKLPGNQEIAVGPVVSLLKQTVATPERRECQPIDKMEKLKDIKHYLKAGNREKGWVSSLPRNR